MARVMIQNEGKVIEIADNQNLREALLAAKVPLYNGARKLLNCRGHGSCGSCEILVIEGAEKLSARTPAEHKKLKTYDSASRLACQCAILGDEEITINTMAI